VENQGNISMNCCSLFKVSRKFRQFFRNKCRYPMIGHPEFCL